MLQSEFKNNICTANIYTKIYNAITFKEKCSYFDNNQFCVRHFTSYKLSLFFNVFIQLFFKSSFKKTEIKKY